MKKRKALWITLLILAVLAVVCRIYVSDYYHAEPEALRALESDALVRVSETDYGWLFDGPATDRALIFYPGGKVEETAYAPFLRLLAEEGIDVCLVRMPARLAFLGMERAADVMKEYDYASWYVGGHSLGGAAAAIFASRHGGELDGLILCAAYPTRPLDGSLREITLYGSADGVLDLSKVEAGRRYAPAGADEYVIEGGNHAGFGNYGAQSGDGEASLSAAEQQREAAARILSDLT